MADVWIFYAKSTKHSDWKVCLLHTDLCRWDKRIHWICVVSSDICSYAAMRVFYAVKMPENDRFVSYKHIHHVQLFILHKHFCDITCIYINVGSCQNPVTVGKCFSFLWRESVFNPHYPLVFQCSGCGRTQHKCVVLLGGSSQLASG